MKLGDFLKTLHACCKVNIWDRYLPLYRGDADMYQGDENKVIDWAIVENDELKIYVKGDL